MRTTLAPFRRSFVSISVAAAATIGLGSFLIQPPLSDDTTAYVETLANSSGAVIGLQAFVLSQVFWAIGLVAAAHLAAGRARVLALISALLTGLGAFGHSVYGGVLLTQLALAGADPDAAAAAVAVGQAPMFVPYLIMGLGGTVFGLVLLAVALMRSHTAPLWVSIGLIVWTLVEFLLPAFVDWSIYASLVVGLIVFGGLAIAVWRSDLAIWRTEAESSTVVAQDSAAATVAAAQ